MKLETVSTGPNCQKHKFQRFGSLWDVFCRNCVLWPIVIYITFCIWMILYIQNVDILTYMAEIDMQHIHLWIYLHIPNALYTTNTAYTYFIFTYSLPVWRIGFGKLHHKNWHQKSASECSGCHIIQLYPHPVAGLVSVTSNAPNAVMVDHADFSISSIYGMRRFLFSHSTLESWKDPKNQIL